MATLAKDARRQAGKRKKGKLSAFSRDFDADLVNVVVDSPGVDSLVLRIAITRGEAEHYVKSFNSVKDDADLAARIVPISREALANLAGATRQAPRWYFDILGVDGEVIVNNAHIGTFEECAAKARTLADVIQEFGIPDMGVAVGIYDQPKKRHADGQS